MKPIIAALIVFAAFGCKHTDTTETAAPATEPGALPSDKPMANAVPADNKPAAAEPRADAPKPAAANDMADKSGTANMPDKAAADMPADNTGNNARDQKTAALTPMDQSETAADRAISQEARSSVVKADDMSMNGKNVKIMTVDGVVTLRGPVASAREKKDIANLVKKIDGVRRVDNQLEVAAK